VAFTPSRPLSDPTKVDLGDYLDNVDPTTLLRDPRFQREYREMRKRQADGENADSWSEDELIDDFYTHQTWINNNSIAGVTDWVRGKFTDDAQRERMGRIQRAYELAPTRDFTDGGAWTDWAASTLIDPLNAFSVAKGAGGAWRAARAGEGVGAIIKGGAKSGAIAGAAENAVSEVALDAINQGRFNEIGVQDGYDFGRGAISAVGGAAAGGLLGGALGGLTAGLQSRGMRRTAAELTEAGVPEQVIGQTDYGQAQELLANLDGQPYPTPTPDPATATPDPSATPAEQVPGAQADTFDPNMLAEAKARAEAQLDQLISEGAPPAVIKQAQANVVRMAELQQINDLRDNVKKNTDILLQSDDAKTRAKGVANQRRVAELESLARRLRNDPNVAEIKLVKAEAERIAGEAEAPPAAVAEGVTAEPAPEPKLPEPTEGPPKPADFGTKTPGTTPEVAPIPERKPYTLPDNLLDVDEDADEAFDIIDDLIAPVRGVEQFRTAFEATARAKFPDKADEIIKLYAERYGNDLGVPRADYERITAQRAAEAKPQAPDRAAKRRAAKNSKSGGMGEVNNEMASGKSLAEQLQESGLLGSLVRRGALARGAAPADAAAAAARADASAAEAIERTAKNNRLTATPGEKVKPKASQTGRAVDTLATGPVTAGRAENGRPQEILRSGQATERDPVTGEATRTITDGTAPQRGQLSREAFELEALRNSKERMVPQRDEAGKIVTDADGKPVLVQAEAQPVALWTATEPMEGVIGGTSRTYTTKRGKTKKQTGYVPRGTTLFYSPHTKRYYTTEADALAASGRGPKRPIPTTTLAERGLVRTEDAPTPEATPATDGTDLLDKVAEWTRQLLAGDLTPDEFAELVRGANRVEARNSPDAAEAARAEAITPEVEAGRVPAIRSKTNPNDVRVLSQRQREAGLGIEALYGKSDPNSFEVGSVPEGTRSASDKARDGFRTATPEEIAAAAAADADPLDKLPIPLDEARRTNVDFTKLSSDEFASVQTAVQLMREAKQVGPGFRVARDSEFSLYEFFGMISHLENLPWTRSATKIDATIETLEGLYGVWARIAPNGIDMPVAAKREANERIDAIFAGHDPKEIAAAKSFLDRLSSKFAPDLGGSRGENFYRGWTPDPDKRGLNRVVLNANKGGIPKLAALYHEVAHWAYINILTPEDRLNFWRGVRESAFEGDVFDAQGVRRRSAPTEVVTNATLSPQEYFANQFTAWMMRGPDKDVWADKSFWQKMWAYMVDIFNRFAAKDFIDPELEPLFAKIIPDPAEAARFGALKPHGAFSNAQSRYIVGHLNLVNSLHDDLTRALSNYEVETAIATAQDLAEFLFKLTAIRNTFAPMRGDARIPAGEGRGDIAKILRDAAYKISDALEAKPDEDFLATWASRVDGRDYDDALDEEFDAASIWLSKNDPEAGPAKTDPTRVFDAIKAIFDDGTDTSIDNAVVFTSYRLNMALSKAEGRSMAFTRKELPNAYRAGKQFRNTPRSTERVRVAKEKVAKAEKKAVAEAEKYTQTPAAKREDAPKAKAGPAPTKTQALPDLPYEDLIKRFYAGKRDERSAVAQELTRRMRAEPDPGFAAMKVPEDIRTGRDLDAMLLKSLEDGDPERVQQIMYEVWRRGENRRRKKAGLPVLRASLSTHLNDAISREYAQSVGNVGDGIVPGAPTVVREIQSFMSHRDPDVQHTMRTLVYRALNLKGKAVRNALDNTSIITTGDVYRLANKPLPPGATAAFADFRGEGFSSLRSSLRKTAIGLTKDVSDPFDVMHEVHHLALRSGIFDNDDFALIREQFLEAARNGERVAAKRMALYAPSTTVDDLSPNKIDELAEEWFAEQGAIYSMGKVAKGDLFAIREGRDMRELSARSTLVMLANRMIDAVAYLVNGLLGRKTLKQMFRRIDGYGDLFDGARRLLDADPRTGGVAPEYAAAYYGDLMRSMSMERKIRMTEFANNGLGIDADGNIRVYYHGTPNGDVLSSPDAVMQPGRGDYGRGVYVTTNQMVADKVYANNSTYDAMMTRARVLREEGRLDPADYDEAIENIALIANIRRDIGTMTRKRAMLAVQDAEVRSAPKKTAEDFDRDIASLREAERFLLADLEGLGLTNAPKVMGLVVRASNPADFRPTATYTRENSFLLDLIADLEEAGKVNFRDAQLWITSIPDEGLNGMELHGRLANLLVQGADGKMHPTQATSIIADTLGKRGYDSIVATFPNTVPDVGQVFHEGLVLIDHVDPVSGQRVAASNKVKSVEASAFDETEPLLYASLIENTPAPNGDVIRMVMEDRVVDGRLMADVVNHLDAAKAPPEFTETLVAAARQRRIQAGKAYNSFRNFFTAVLRANSTRMENAGLKSIAAWHKGHYIDHAVALGDRVFTLRDILNTLPDSPGNFRRWFENIKPGPQPLSHARILKALRMGTGSNEFRALNETEQQAALKIRSMLDGEYEELRRAGVLVGRVDNYFPQIWDVETLSANKDEFIEELGNYFIAESRYEGRPLSVEEAQSRAMGVWGRLLDDEGNYLPPPVGSSRTADSDHLRYQRLIRLENPEFAENARRLNKFLVNDLEGTLIKYFDGSTRSSLQARRFGVMNHGYYDYLRVMDEGLDGIAALLSTNRVSRRDIKLIADDGYLATLEFRDETLMPFKGDDYGARDAARNVKEIFDRDGAAAAKAYLMSLDPARNKPAAADGMLRADKSTYEHRVDAIVDALRDGAGKRGHVPVKEIMFAQDAMQSALRKQVGSGPLHTEAARDGSRFIRTFNAVSLLSFTTLTSLPDLIMPTIKSGKAGAHIRALQKMSSDPDYRRAIRNTGVAVENIVHQRMAGLFASDISGKLGKFNNAFFNATLLTPWTDMNRSIAGAVGFEAFQVDVAKALRAKVGDGMNMAEQPAEYRRIMRRLKAYGLDGYVLEGRVIDQRALEEDPVLKSAVVQFANESIFAPNPDDMPLWTQTPWGSILWQLKSYPVMLGRMSAEIIGSNIGDARRAFAAKDLSELDPDNMKRLAYLFALGPAFGAAALAGKDIVQQRGGEDSREAAVRNRSWEKFLGYSKEIHGDKNDFAGWYAEGLMAMGGLGLLADVLHSVAEGAEQGAFGQTRALGAVLGPTVGTFGSGVTILGGIKDADENSNSKERAAWREAIRRVPFIGGMGGLREGAVDAIAGEKGMADDGAAKTDEGGGSISPEEGGWVK